jgi:hypothetical protein
MAQGIEHLPSKLKDQSSNVSTAKNLLEERIFISNISTHTYNVFWSNSPPVVLKGGF